jgi:hypothetical protein
MLYFGLFNTKFYVFSMVDIGNETFVKLGNESSWHANHLKIACCSQEFKFNCIQNLAAMAKHGVAKLVQTE